MNRLFILLLTWVAGSNAINTSPYGLHVNREANEALAVDPSGLVIGWAVPPDAEQKSFNIRLHNALGLQLGEYACAAQASINCSHSDSVVLATLAGSSLPEGGSFAFQVQLVDQKGVGGTWSEAFHFATALSEGQMGSVAVPVWSRNATQNFVLFRRTFKASAGEHLLHITAKSVPNRMHGGGANASKLLCAYKLWLNGVSIAVGPGRPTGNGSTIQRPALLYDTVNITSLLRRGGTSNALAVEAFYWTNIQEKQYIPTTLAIDGDHDDLGGIMLLVRATQAGPTEQTVVATGDDGDWLSFDRGDEALSPYDPRQESTFCQAMCPHAKKGATCNFCLASGGRFQVSKRSSPFC
jgi:hypothetical protein